ncbi:MAG: ABC transporter permease subunit [Streptosporangiales bacterium]|nr:ABC transporter permease subunit [Streptosporangiales bacterium]
MTASTAVRRRPAGVGRRLRRWLDWMAIPTIVILAVVIAYPIIEAIRVSFFDYNLLAGEAGAEFNGIENYSKLATDPVFWESLKNTVIFTGGSVVGGGMLGLVMALATENLGGAWRWLRGVLLTPWAIPVIVVSFLFRYVFDQDSGILNALLARVGVADAVPWLTAPEWALASVTAANIWSQAPFFLLIFTAALGSVPTEVIEAARIDRASVWSMIVQIKLSYLRGAALVGALIMTIQNFNNFPLIWSMTEGGPAYSTTTLLIYVYRLAFTTYDLGYASAIGVIWLVLLLFLAGLFVRTLRGDRA